MSQAGVDLILTRGYYTDRRGREWRAHNDTHWLHIRDTWTNGIPFYLLPTVPQMRLLIERDMHRDECVGIHWCLTHPVVSVDYDGVLGLWKVWGPGDWFRGTFRTLSDAMDAAYRLAVEHD